MQGRLYAKTEEEKLLKEKQPDMFERILTLDDLVQGDAALFVATGVTDGDMLRGVRYLPNNVVKTHSVVMRSETGTIRFVEALHHMDRKPAYAQVSK